MDDITLERIVDNLRIQPRETEWLEFKLNYSNPQDIGEYISALSNSACLEDKPKAFLIYGIEDETHNVIGTNFKPSKTKKGNEELESWLMHNLNPRIDFKIYEFLSDDKPIVLFEIDKAINSPVKFKDTAFIRVGTYKKKLSDYPEKERKIWMKTRQEVFEHDIAMNNVNEYEVFKLLDYPSYFTLMGIPLPDNRKTILEKFEEEKLIQKQGDEYQITNLGAILFAKNLTPFEKLSRKAVRVIIYVGRDRLKTKKESLGRKGYAVGFEYLINYINDLLPSNEEIGKAFRKEVKMYPELAIRELVANALIHQDFHEKGTGPMIEIFSDRIEISNPGKPIIDTLRFIDHAPQSRNEQLAHFMRRINICEERGSGIDKVISSVETFQLPAPNFIEGDNYLRAILFAHKSLRQMGKIDKIRACYQHCCLKYISADLMTNKSLRERFNIEEQNYSVASRIISETIKEGLIKDFDPDSKSKKFAKYIPFWV
jgi:predicted HTH transcriptional regulator